MSDATQCITPAAATTYDPDLAASMLARQVDLEPLRETREGFLVRPAACAPRAGSLAEFVCDATGPYLRAALDLEGPMSPRADATKSLAAELDCDVVRSGAQAWVRQPWTTGALAFVSDPAIFRVQALARALGSAGPGLEDVPQWLLARVAASGVLLDGGRRVAYMQLEDGTLVWAQHSPDQSSGQDEAILLSDVGEVARLRRHDDVLTVTWRAGVSGSAYEELVRAWTAEMQPAPRVIGWSEPSASGFLSMMSELGERASAHDTSAPDRPASTKETTKLRVARQSPSAEDFLALAGPHGLLDEDEETVRIDLGRGNRWWFGLGGSGAARGCPEDCFGVSARGSGGEFYCAWIATGVDGALEIRSSEGRRDRSAVPFLRRLCEEAGFPDVPVSRAPRRQRHQEDAPPWERPGRRRRASEVEVGDPSEVEVGTPEWFYRTAVAEGGRVDPADTSVRLPFAPPMTWFNKAGEPMASQLDGRRDVFGTDGGGGPCPRVVIRRKADKFVIAVGTDGDASVGQRVARNLADWLVAADVPERSMKIVKLKPPRVPRAPWQRAADHALDVDEDL